MAPKGHLRYGRLAALAVLAIAVLSPPGIRPAHPQSANQPVELELVLAVDASSSIQSDEFDLQVQGYANAFRDPSVIEAIEELGGGGIAVTLVQWSATHQMYQSVPWTHVHDRASGEQLAQSIERNFWTFTPFGTALGDAIEYSVGLFETSGYAGRRQAIDISADERANMGKHPSRVQQLALDAGITVNGLVVLDKQLDLVAYFLEHVIVGDGAFVEVVEQKQDLANSIKRKLVREISGIASLRKNGSRLVTRY